MIADIGIAPGQEFAVLWDPWRYPIVRRVVEIWPQFVLMQVITGPCGGRMLKLDEQDLMAYLHAAARVT